MKRQWLAALLCSWLCLGVAHGAEAPAKFLFAYGAIGGNAVPLWIAKEQGIFRKYNLEPQLIYIIAGRAMQSMLAGDIQFGLLGATHVTNAVTAGGDMVMLLGMEERLNYFLNVRPGIKSAEDLKGKKIGIGTPSGSLALATYTWAGPSGSGATARPHHSVEHWQHAGTHVCFVRRRHRRSVFQSGGRAIVIAQQGFPALFDLGKANVPFQSSGLATSRKYMRANPQLVENLAKAVHRRRRVRAKSGQQENRHRQHRAEFTDRSRRSFGTRLSDDLRILSAQTVPELARHRIGFKTDGATRTQSSSNRDKAGEYRGYESV